MLTRFFAFVFQLCAESEGEKIYNIFSCEQQEVCKSHQGEQAVREQIDRIGHIENIDKHND